MSPATTVTLPVHMRIGDGAEFEVGTVEADLATGTTEPELPGLRPRLAALLRTAADAVEEQEDDRRP